MQQKRCATSLSHATSPYQEVAIEAHRYWIFLKDKVLGPGRVM